jgi:hypothetical protein
MDVADRSVTVVTTAPTPTAVVAETTTWDDFPNRWRSFGARGSGPGAT